MIGTGFPYHSFEHIDAYLGTLKELMQKSSGIRRPGAASLDLAYVACGRLDGFWEFGLAPWDIIDPSWQSTVAGSSALPITKLDDLSGNENYLETGNVIAGTPKVFAQLLQVVDSHRTARLGA